MSTTGTAVPKSPPDAAIPATRWRPIIPPATRVIERKVPPTSTPMKATGPAPTKVKTAPAELPLK
eukprot:6764903-Prorocentrum_lima.AAC.1